MGMDLKPIAPAPDAPRDPDGSLAWGRYNISGWGWLIERLGEWGVDTSEFVWFNDGAPISAETCRQVGDAIEQHLDELTDRHRAWITPHVARWRTCGGYEQR